LVTRDRQLHPASVPPRVSEQDVQRHSPDAAYYALQLRRASNANPKNEFRFAPRPLEWLVR
jgi:hypothetical protein